jgi:hypothetical protein
MSSFRAMRISAERSQHVLGTPGRCLLGECPVVGKVSPWGSANYGGISFLADGQLHRSCPGRVSSYVSIEKRGRFARPMAALAILLQNRATSLAVGRRIHVSHLRPGGDSRRDCKQ